MRTALLVLALLAAPAFAGQTVWKWVDEKGITHYSDQPIPGAQRMEISTGSRSDSVSTSPPRSSSSPSSSTPAATSYRNFEIWKPGDQDTIANTGGAVDVRLRYEPALQPGHSLYLYLDGRLVQDFPPTAQEYALRDVPRGMHSLIAVIQDSRGNRIQESSQVRFTVRQESVAQPPVGPALRPPPKPRGQQAGNKLLTSQPSYAALNGTQPKIDPRTNKPVRP
jgi:hypothetical protein